MADYRKMFIEIDGKRVLMGEVEVFLTYNTPYEMVTPIEVNIKNITMLRKKYDFIKLNNGKE